MELTLEDRANDAYLSLLYSLKTLSREERHLCFGVLDNEDFFSAPGGSEHHHNYKHGLIIHTAEVMNNAQKLCSGWKLPDELIIAVIWHDFMKIKDYAIVDQEIISLPYKKLINHVSGSCMEFHSAAKAIGMEPNKMERIEHILLSHHGRKEWGSPVEPRTAEAFVMHTADMMSASGIVL